METHPIMGVGLFAFAHDEWKKLYATNCANHSMIGHANIPIGFLYSTVGITSELMYIPFMIVMTRKEFMQHSCYKFMFVLGIIDMVTLPFNAIITGVQSMNGIHYCTNPAFFYIVGSVAVAGWFGATMTCCLIAIDRFLSYFLPSLCAKVFSEKLMRLWVLVPIVYWFFIIFYNVTPIYHINILTMNYDPWYGEKNLEGNPEYHDAQMLHVNSFFTVPILVGCYAILCIVTTVNALIFKHSIMTNLQRVMLYQSMCICVEIFITATVYVANSTGILAIPEVLAPVEHGTWILVHADTPIVYLIFNRSLRKAAFEWTNKNLLKRNPNRIHNFITTHMI